MIGFLNRGPNQNGIFTKFSTNFRTSNFAAKFLPTQEVGWENPTNPFLGGYLPPQLFLAQSPKVPPKVLFQKSTKLMAAGSRQPTSQSQTKVQNTNLGEIFGFWGAKNQFFTSYYYPHIFSSLNFI